jgi:alpha(1,3/1,4) fucosyltransferase
MKPRIRLGFSDFWPGFGPQVNYFTRMLAPSYEIELSDRPDFLIYSCFGQKFRRHRGIRIFYSGENFRPDFADCDYAFTFDLCDHPNHVRLPFWYMRHMWNPLPTKQDFDPRAVLAEKTRFCNFVYSNKYCSIRNRFFRRLSKYKRVDSAGKLFNNIGGPIGLRGTDKIEFIRPHKFSIAFENESYPGYTTEKIYEAMVVNSLPIYWGNPRVDVDFNPNSFLNFHDYGSLEALLNRVIEVDQDDELYCHYLSQPWFPEDQNPLTIDTEKVLAQFDRIFSTDKTPVAQQSHSVRYFIIHPPRRAATMLKRRSVRLARKIRYHLDVAG